MKNLSTQVEPSEPSKTNTCGYNFGVFLALTIPDATKWVSIFGSLFVGALKAVAPILVLFLVMHAISKHRNGQKTNMKSISGYILGTFLAGFVAVVASFIFPVTLTLTTSAQDVAPPSGILEVIQTYYLISLPIQ